VREDATDPDSIGQAARSDQAAPMEVPESVAELTAGMDGTWCVTTQGSTHVWDLRAGTYARIPGPFSRAGAMPYDGAAHRITHVERWPCVGDVSMVWYDDPVDPERYEQWRRSSTIASITRMAIKVGDD
jgi:hypothetical protein